MVNPQAADIEVSPAIALEPVPLITELGGRQRNITKVKNWFMAVAESIQNAMDAISDSGPGGKVTVTIERRADLASMGGSGPAPIKCVVVEDNGVGFDHQNFTSFCTPDS